MENIKGVNSALRRISEMKIFFAHQSVGKNIIDGISDIGKGIDSDIVIADLESMDNMKDINWVHTYVGENGNPQKKVSDFIIKFEEVAKYGIDIAFMKFCYADFDEGTDVEKLYELYVSTIEILKKRHPETVFIYMTSPLTAEGNRIKNIIKGIMGKKIIGREDNVPRNNFNNLIRNRINENETGYLFDLAKFEATYPDGKEKQFVDNDKVYQALVPDYTDDGGHLNEAGRRKIAEELILFIDRIFKKEAVL